MKYSYQWLKELSGTKKTPVELAEMVMLKGFELEEIIDLGQRFEKIVVGQVKSRSNHPKADKLQVVHVDAGEHGQDLEIVCGAWNFQEGDKVPVALVGAVVPHSKMKVEAREVRGVVSNGMLCAEDELGLGKDHSGIIILDKDTPVGQPLAKALQLDHAVIDLSVLPNRAHDCLSHVGLAREICAMEGRKLVLDPGKEARSVSQEGLEIEIKNPDLCPRYIGALLNGVKVGPSPVWMQARLVAAGMEPINNVVDITNYVMLELGNPLHAFDAEKISAGKDGNKKIVVRTAKENEALELLDGSQLKLVKADLVIADEGKVLALAGIKGGKHSGIALDTQSVILESANFNGFNIRRTRQRHNLLTESQSRFEKGISPVLAKQAVQRAIELLAQHANAKLVSYHDEDRSPKENQKESLALQEVNRLLGETVNRSEVEKILVNLGFEIISSRDDEITVQVPDWRLDIEGSADLVEEVGRIIGYEHIPAKPLVKEVALPTQNRQRALEWEAKDRLSGLGFDEVINYSFYSQSDAELFSSDEHFEIENPLASELVLMRKSLLPGLFRNTALNEKYYDQFRLFEIGRVYPFATDVEPVEELKVSGAFYDAKLSEEQLFYHLKGVLEAFLSFMVGPGRMRCESLAEASSLSFNLARTAAIFLDERPLGVIGLAQAKAAKLYGIKKSVALFEIDFDEIARSIGQGRCYQPARRFPEVKRDISMFVAYRVETAAIEEVIREAGSDLLLETELFDSYQDKEKNRKSLAFHLAFGRDDRTLESQEVDQVMEKIRENLEKKLAAQARV